MPATCRRRTVLHRRHTPSRPAGCNPSAGAAKRPDPSPRFPGIFAERSIGGEQALSISRSRGENIRDRHRSMVSPVLRAFTTATRRGSSVVGPGVAGENGARRAAILVVGYAASRAPLTAVVSAITFSDRPHPAIKGRDGLCSHLGRPSGVRSTLHRRLPPGNATVMIRPGWWVANKDAAARAFRHATTAARVNGALHKAIGVTMGQFLP